MTNFLQFTRHHRADPGASARVTRLASKGTLEDTISRFGSAAKAKLSNKAATGAPEDQLRAPLEGSFTDLALLGGFTEGRLPRRSPAEIQMQWQ